MSNKKTLKKNFNNNGACLYRNFLSTKERKEICKILLKIISRYLSKNFFLINDNNLHQNLLQLRSKNPKKFGKLYDELALNSKLRSFFYKEKFISLASKILNTSEENLFINGFMLRLDAPNDNRNNLDWHQDAPYYLQTSPKFDAFVAWLPLTKNTIENGSLIYLRNSHRKLLNSKFNRKSDFHSGQYNIKVPSNKEEDMFDLKLGDLSIFHMKTVHRSGKNVSKKFRINFGCRVHKISKYFNVGKEKYFFNKTNKETL